MDLVATKDAENSDLEKRREHRVERDLTRNDGGKQTKLDLVQHHDQTPLA